jgi:hypothetical protein
MTGKSLPLFSAAVLLWMPKGQEPDIQKFDPSQIQAPPAANPEPWWLLHEAITYAMTVERSHSKVPWIKVGDELLSPSEIANIYKSMGNLSGFSSDADRT